MLPHLRIVQEIFACDRHIVMYCSAFEYRTINSLQLVSEKVDNQAQNGRTRVLMSQFILVP